MITEQYGMTVETALSFDEAEEHIRAALADVGFGILTEIDVAATFKAKLDLDRSAYKILGACNPVLASQAIEIDPRAGLLLPCNVVLEDTGAGTVVTILDPDKMVSLMDAEGVDAFAAEARELLQKALATLE